MSVSLVDLINILEAENQTIKKVQLFDLESLEAKHFSGINKSSVKWLNLEYVKTKYDTLSQLSKLQKLYILVLNAEDLPDLSSLKVFKILDISISLNGPGNKTGE